MTEGPQEPAEPPQEYREPVEEDHPQDVEETDD